MYFKKRYVFKNLQVLFWDLRHGIKNLFAYFKIVWNDRDWDFDFLEQLLLFKLNRIKKNYPIDYGDFMVGKDIYEEVKMAISLLELARANDDEPPFDNEKRIDAYCYIAEHLRNWWD